jgi:membrane protein required for colicin V production
VIKREVGNFVYFYHIICDFMNYIDMFIMVLLIYAVFRGFTRGLVLQLASLVALLAGIFLALKFSGFTARYLIKHWALDYEYLYLVSLAITFTLVFIMISILGNLLDKVVQTAHLSIINKLAGAFFNVCKVMLIMGVLLLFIDRVDSRISLLPKNARENSFFYKPVTSTTLFLFPSLGNINKDNRHEDFV